MKNDFPYKFFILLLCFSISCKEKKVKSITEITIKKKDIIVEKPKINNMGFRKDSIISLLKTKHPYSLVQFNKDSTFFVSNLESKNIEQNLTKFDSIIMKYSFETELKLISNDTLEYYIETINYPKITYKTLKIYGKPFMFMNQECEREFVSNIYSMNLKGSHFHMNIINSKTRDTILNGMGENNEIYLDFESLFYSSNTGMPELDDYNFDGYGDIAFYNNIKSGSAGSFDDIYLYNPKKRTFEFSEKISGYNLYVDKKAKVITSSSQNHYHRIIKFNNNSTLKYIEEFRSDYIDINKNESIFTYNRIKKSEIIQTTKDTVIDGDFWEWVNNYGE